MSARTVTVGSRSQVASADYPGPARDVLEQHLGGLALFPQGCGGNVNPRVGIGYEVDCSDTKNRIGLELGGEALRVAARIRTATRAGAGAGRGGATGRGGGVGVGHGLPERMGEAVAGWPPPRYQDAVERRRVTRPGGQPA